MGPGASALNGAVRATWGPRGPRGLTSPGGLVSECQGNPRERGHESLRHLLSKPPIHPALFRPGPCGWALAPQQECGCSCVWGTRAAGQARIPGQRALLPEGWGQGLVPAPPHPDLGQLPCALVVLQEGTRPGVESGLRAGRGSGVQSPALRGVTSAGCLRLMFFTPGQSAHAGACRRAWPVQLPGPFAWSSDPGPLLPPGSQAHLLSSPPQS